MSRAFSSSLSCHRGRFLSHAHTRRHACISSHQPINRDHKAHHKAYAAENTAEISADYQQRTTMIKRAPPIHPPNFHPRQTIPPPPPPPPLQKRLPRGLPRSPSEPKYISHALKRWYIRGTHQWCSARFKSARRESRRKKKEQQKLVRITGRQKNACAKSKAGGGGGGRGQGKGTGRVKKEKRLTKKKRFG